MATTNMAEHADPRNIGVKSKPEAKHSPPPLHVQPLSALPASHAEEMSPIQKPNQAAFQTQEQAGGMICISPALLRGKSGLSRVDLALYAYILDTPAEAQGSRAEIAEDCECAPNSVPRSAKKLEAMGLIARVKGGGAAHTKYQPTRNMEVTRNVEVTTAETSTLRAAFGVAPTETITTDMVVTSVTGGRNNPPLEPPIRTTSNSEPSNTEFVVEGTGGDLFGGKPARKTRRKPKIVATNETMPREPTAAMLKHAGENDFYNGNVERMFAKWRDFHIAKATPIADHEASWRTWVGNAVEFRERDEAKGKGGLRVAGVGADGVTRYNRKRSYYVGQ